MRYDSGMMCEIWSHDRKPDFWPKMAHLSTLRKSEIVVFADFSVGTARDDFILGQVATNSLYLS